MPKNRLCKPIESQEVTVGPDEAPIGGLNPETSRGTVKERPRMPTESRDEVKMDDTRRNPKGYNALLQFVSLWHLRLGHPGLDLLKKTVKITSGIPNLNVVKKEDFVCLAYDRSKAVRRLNLRVLLDPLKILDILEGDTFKVKLRPYNKRLIELFIIDRKSQFRWVILLLNC